MLQNTEKNVSLPLRSWIPGREIDVAEDETRNGCKDSQGEAVKGSWLEESCPHDAEESEERRQKGAAKDSRKKTVVLFHAASTGEYEQLKPVLKKMDRNRFFILQSFFSPTVYKYEKIQN